MTLLPLLRLDPWRAPAVFAFVFAIAQLSTASGVEVAFCAFDALAGIPCPGCGITTSVGYLFAGNLAAAVEANAAGPFVALFVVAQLSVGAIAAAGVLPNAAIFRWSSLNDRALLAVLLFTWLTRFV